MRDQVEDGSQPSGERVWFPPPCTPGSFLTRCSMALMNVIATDAIRGWLMIYLSKHCSNCLINVQIRSLTEIEAIQLLKNKLSEGSIFIFSVPFSIST